MGDKKSPPHRLLTRSQIISGKHREILWVEYFFVNHQILARDKKRNRTPCNDINGIRDKVSQILSDTVNLWEITFLITPIFGTHIHGLHTLYHTPP